MGHMNATRGRSQAKWVPVPCVESLQLFSLRAVRRCVGLPSSEDSRLSPPPPALSAPHVPLTSTFQPPHRVL